MNILLTCAGRRNYLVKYFREALAGSGKVVAADMDMRAPAMADADVAVQVPAVYADNYISVLAEIIRKHDVKALVSLNDLELPVLSAGRTELENTGCKIVLASESVIDIAFDKWKTVEFLQSVGLAAPRTWLTVQDALAAIGSGEASFPLVIKPRWGSASIGVDYPESADELKLAYKLQAIRLHRGILARASEADAEHAILIQEKMPGKEYGMDVLNDLDGSYFGTYVREKLAMRAGETDKAISIIDERFEKLGRKLGEALGHIGNMDCDVFEKDGELYVLELNPRFGGGYPFSHEAGINTVAIYIEWLKGNKNVSKFDRYKAGYVFSKYDRLVMML